MQLQVLPGRRVFGGNQATGERGEPIAFNHIGRMEKRLERRERGSGGGRGRNASKRSDARTPVRPAHLDMPLHLVVLLVALRPQLLEGRRIVDDLALVGKAQQPLF